MRRIFTVLAAFFALAACKPQQEILQTWMGAPEDKLVSIWGNPTEAFTTEEGVQILVYTKDPRNDLIVPSGGRNPAAGTSNQICETTFTLEEGRVVAYTRGGSGC